MEINEILEQVDIVEYISQYIDLEERGDEYWGLSCFQDERTPSFSIRPDTGQWYDFSSGQGGNIISFIEKYHKVSTYRAVQMVKKYAGIEEDESTPSVLKRLPSTSIAKRYRPSQKKIKEFSGVILPDDYMDRFDWNEDKLSVWRDEDITDEAMRFFQVRYDPISDRIVYPIRNINGEIINVSGRTIDPDYKSKRLRKYTYFQPFGALDTIYGLYENYDEIIAQHELILFEGAKSVMKARGWGFYNTGALCTSHLNPNQFKILIKLGVKVVFALDSGVNVSEDKNIRRLLPYVSVEYLSDQTGILQAKDAPVDQGEEVFRKLYEERRRLR